MTDLPPPKPVPSEDVPSLFAPTPRGWKTVGWPNQRPLSPVRPYARVQQVRRWTYMITIAGGSPAAAWWRVGHKRAERKARKVLAAYIRDQERRRNEWEITA